MLSGFTDEENLPGTLLELCCEPGRTEYVLTERVLLETLMVLGRAATGRALTVESGAPDVRGLAAPSTCGLGANFFFLGFTPVYAATSSFQRVMLERSAPEG